LPGRTKSPQLGAQLLVSRGSQDTVAQLLETGNAIYRVGEAKHIRCFSRVHQPDSADYLIRRINQVSGVKGILHTVLICFPEMKAVSFDEMQRKPRIN